MNSRAKKLKRLESITKGNGRKNALRRLEKAADADQHGAFQHFQSNVTEYATRERYISQRGGTPPERTTEGLYNLSPEHEDSYVPTAHVATHLSTRYSPDRVGVQALRVSDGVFQDPYTNKIYDYNEGFKAEDGRTFPPGSAALQSSMMHMANHLDGKGLIKEANYLDALIQKTASFLKIAPLVPTYALEPDYVPPGTKTLSEEEEEEEELKPGPPQTKPDGQSRTDEKVVASMIHLASHLDKKGLVKEANYLDSLIKKTKE